MGSITADFVSANEPRERKKLVLRGKKEPVRKKNIHMIIKGDDLKRLEALQARVDPGTQTEVFINALQLLDEIIHEHDSESEFFIKRKSDNTPVPYDILG